MIGSTVFQSITARIKAVYTALADAATAANGAGAIGFLYATAYAGNTVGAWLKGLAASTGATFIGWIQAGVGAVLRTVQAKLRESVSVLDFGADPTGVADSTAAIMAAIASFPNQGSPNWKPWQLLFPPGTYKVTSTVSILNQQNSFVCAHGATLVGNFDAPILQIGDTSGNNDVLWTQIEGLIVVQNATTANAMAVVGRHLYSCTIRDCYFYGGQIAFDLDGNNNLMVGTTFRNGIAACAKAGLGANNEENTWLACGFENSTGYGLKLAGASGAYGHNIVRSCYFENNTLGGLYVQNGMKWLCTDSYFNLQNNAPGIVLDGTTGSAILGQLNEATGNRINGGTGGQFIKELSATSTNCGYKNNTLEAGTCDLYGQAYKSINLARRSDQCVVTNGAFAGGPPPTGWTVVNGPVASVAANSPYGGAGGVQVPANGYLWQNISCPAGSLLRISVWASTTGTAAQLAAWTAGVGAQISIASTASATAVRLEIYLSALDRANATSFAVLLRNTGTLNATFSGLVIEDMTQ